MFDKYIICEEGFRRDGERGGRIEVRMPYYRGLGLSMVEAVDITLDGNPVPPERTIIVKKRTFCEVRDAVSALRPKADMCAAAHYVRCGP